MRIEKITIYELLGLIKDGKAPKKIKFRNEIYEYKNNIEDGFIDYVGIEKETNVNFYLSSDIGNNYISDIFTDEVEIIEESNEIEIPKHIPNDVIQDLDGALYPENVKCIAHKVNEIINYLQYREKKQEQED